VEQVVVVEVGVQQVVVELVVKELLIVIQQHR